MKFKSLVAAVALFVTLLLPNQVSARVMSSAGVEKTVSDGLFTVTAAPFPGLGERWNFTISRAGNWLPGDWAYLRLKDSNGVELDYDFQYVSVYGSAQPTMKFVLEVNKGVTPTTIGAGLFAVLDVDYADYLQPDSITSYRLPSELFPSAPQSDSDYVKLAEGTPLFTKPSSCRAQTVFLRVTDPYQEISTLKVALVESNGSEIASDTVPVQASAILDPYASFLLCASDFAMIRPVKLVVTVTWADKNRAKYSFTGPAELSPYSSGEIANVVSSLPTSCLKGATLKNISTSACPRGYRKLAFRTPSITQWNTVARQPGSLIQSNWLVFGCIAQLDAQTGPGAFRAETSWTELTGSSKLVNSWLTWNKSSLLAFGEGDLFVANITVSGKQKYSTLLGGSLTVPKFLVRSMKKLGSCNY